MARNNATNITVDDIVTEDATIETVEKMKEEDKVNTKKTINKEPLLNSDEIEVISLVPRVSYKDSKTLDVYEWDEIGHVEYMSFEILQNMWRNNKGYFKNLWLKPNDDRVINKFGLTKTFEKYEYLMDASNYTKTNISKICNAISETPNGLKMSICCKIKNMVIDGDVTDVSVIRALERHLKIDLIEFI